jgi:hypothetical protein
VKARSFVTCQLGGRGSTYATRVETKQFLDEAVGESRHRELVARGEAMNTDDVVAFELSAIESSRQT